MLDGSSSLNQAFVFKNAQLRYGLGQGQEISMIQKDARSKGGLIM